MEFEIKNIIIMKDLLNFIGFMIIVLFFGALISGMRIHTLDENNVNKTFSIKEKVYVLPDSIKGMVEHGYIFTERHKDKITKIRKDSTFLELYRIIYTDKNGVIQRLKNVEPELLIKRNN